VLSKLKHGLTILGLKTIIATAIPKITKEFNSLDQVGWYASVLFLTVAATQSVWGKAYKYFSIKAVYLVSIFVFELGSLICGKDEARHILYFSFALTA
jgi:MFS transporter, DHA2 family, glioxin efflux transporter